MFRCASTRCQASKGMCCLIHSGTNTLSPTKPRSEQHTSCITFCTATLQSHAATSAAIFEFDGDFDQRWFGSEGRVRCKEDVWKVPIMPPMGSSHLIIPLSIALFAGRDRGENFQLSRSGRYAAADDCGGQRQRRKRPLIGGFFR